MRASRIIPWLLASLLGSAAAEQAAVTEKDYLSDLPVVLSVTRLAQPLDETPGAVTVIDREMIRRSGAREVAELLRLVPGFIHTQRNGANPVAVYHAAFDTYGKNLQVFVDGRSVYSTFFLGDTHLGLMGVVLDDIERIEVLRGSNSAAYGANAFLGVVNIVTRHAADTKGAMISASGGERGIADGIVRIGGGDERAAFRMTIARRADTGLALMNDDKRVGQVHFRADLRFSQRDEATITAGINDLALGDGYRGNPGSNIERTIGNKFAFFHGEWRRQVAEDEEIRASASVDEERFSDNWRYPWDPANPLFLGTPIDFGGKARRIDFAAQHSFVPTEGVRAVWGGEFRREEVRSPPLYHVRHALSTEQLRGFGNIEWRPHPRWVVNAGGLVERHDVVGTSFSPRLMANFSALPDHTLRAGVSKAERAPTLYELWGDRRYYPPLVPGLELIFDKMSGRAKPERITASEIGYLGVFRPLGLTLDVRAFDERMKSKLYTFGNPTDVENRPGPRIRGFEYQADWKPFDGTRLILSQAVIRVLSEDIDEKAAAPRRSTSMALFQKLPGNLDLGLIYTATTRMTWRDWKDDMLPSQSRVDVRLAYPFRIGATRAEAAWVVQSIDGKHAEHLGIQPDNGLPQRSGRRAHATLRLEF